MAVNLKKEANLMSLFKKNGRGSRMLRKHIIFFLERRERLGELSWELDSLFNRPGVAGAVLQTPGSLIH